MKSKSSFIFRMVATGGGAALALGVSVGVSAGVATAQTGSLESGFGLDIDSVLSPVGDLFPDPGSLDEAVSDAGAGPGAGSSGAREESQRALPPPVWSGSSGAGPAGAAAAGVTGAGVTGAGETGAGGAAAADGSAGAGAMGVPGAGSLDPIQPALGPGPATDTTPGAALTALITLTGALGEGGPSSAGLPPLPPPR